MKWLPCAVLALSAAPVVAQPRPMFGSIELELELKRLSHLGGVLMIAAHPDDENTALLAYLAQGRNLRTGYLSLTRGEGGQNLIGSEQGVEMGLIRTQELLAARRMDGAQQFFTRAIDFGFSKTADETLAKWGREAVLSDVVWTIRKFRPDVIVLRFTGTPRDGHGHHQSSAMLGKEAFSAAADPARFPEHMKYGVTPWQAKRVVWNTFAFNRQMELEQEKIPEKVPVELGEYSAMLGLSWNEIAGMSRSMHRSQGMGASERKGASRNYLVPVAGEAAKGDMLDGIDPTWRRAPGGAAVADLLDRAVREFDLHAPAKVVPILMEARAKMDAVKDPLAAVKIRETEEWIARAAGLWVDVTAPQPEAVMGSKVDFTVAAISRAAGVKAEIVGVQLSGAAEATADWNTALATNEPLSKKLSAEIRAAAPSQPLWLQEAPSVTMYTIRNQQDIGRPEGEAAIRAAVRVRLNGHEITLQRPVHRRYVDQVRGELTRPVVATPPAGVRIAEPVLVFPDAKPREVSVEISGFAAAEGEASLRAPAGWTVQPASQPYRVGAGEVRTVKFQVTPPAAAQTGELKAQVTAGGRSFTWSRRVVQYDHIPPQTYFPDATAKLVRTNAVSLARKVGYVMGAGDEVPGALGQLGVSVTLLSADDLARADLSGYDAIVTGVRAYNTRDDLRANQQRLLDYVAAGGALVVQYNVAEGGPFGGGDTGRLAKIGPYPLKLSRNRVTVEEAELKPLNPAHPLLNAPNKITAADYEGWVQERGLYFAGEFDAKYEPIYEAADPGEQPSRGVQLYARHGRGVYVFTPLAWFRQLPAGVPGAYRLFANILSAAKTQAPQQAAR